MGLIALQSWSRGASTSVHLLRPVGSNPKLAVHAVKFYTGFKFDVRASSSLKSLKKLRRESQQVSSPRFEEVQVDVVAAPRDKVLQACTVTYGLMAALGLVIRKVSLSESLGFCGFHSQASHAASTEGLPIPDCSTDLPCNIFEGPVYVVFYSI